MSRLSSDLERLRSRREILGLFGAAVAVPLIGCGDNLEGACPGVPEESAGPFPADSGDRDVLGRDDIVRSDIRPSLDGDAVAAGVPLTIALAIGGAGDCAPLPGAAVYVWQCDRAGDYSLYTGAAIDVSYLRGVQVADARGEVSFTSVVPGCYPGRWPHLHLEIFDSLAAATGGESPRRTTQLALPESTCVATYATGGYEGSTERLDRLSLERDGAFADRVDLQLLDVEGDPDRGFAAALALAI